MVMGRQRSTSSFLSPYYFRQSFHKNLLWNWNCTNSNIVIKTVINDFYYLKKNQNLVVYIFLPIWHLLCLSTGNFLVNIWCGFKMNRFWSACIASTAATGRVGPGTCSSHFKRKAETQWAIILNGGIGRTNPLLFWKSVLERTHYHSPSTPGRAWNRDLMI